MHGSLRRHGGSCKAVRKDFTAASSVSLCQRLKNHVVTTLCVGSAVPRSVESDEDAIAIAGRELFLVIVGHGVGRPVGGECSNGANFAGANAHSVAPVTTVLWRQNQLALIWVVVALRPAVVAALFQEHHFFRG